MWYDLYGVFYVVDQRAMFRTTLNLIMNIEDRAK